MNSSTLPIRTSPRHGEASQAIGSSSTKLRLVPHLYPTPQTNAVTLCFVTALTVIAIGIHGYHPYAEDAGIYLPGIKKLLNHSLYPSWSGFVTAQLRLSLFAPIVAGLVLLSHLGLMTVMFALYFVTTWLTLFAAWLIAKRCYWSVEGCYGAVSLLALSLTIPIAGTSLLLIDPYVTARSFSTPCTLFAIAAALDLMRGIRSSDPKTRRSFALCALSLAIAFLIHPLMAGYAFCCVLLLASVSLPNRKLRIVTTFCMCCAAILLATLLDRLSSAQQPQYARVAETRSYWFLSSWHWYELLGLLAPLVIVEALRSPVFRLSHRFRGNAASALAHMAVMAGVTGFVIAGVFAGGSAHSLMVARLQPLRIFLSIYVLMILAIGAMLGERILGRHSLRWVTMFAVLGTIMGFVQMQTFPNSAHIELPWSAPANQWEQGFAWVRNNTPENSVFALDANYISDSGEDAQNFRAIAERSALPDYSKDGGVASIAPDLTNQWIAGEQFQGGLNRTTDAQRIAKLRGSSAQWVVLSQSASTQLFCPYRNSSMKVCRIPKL